MPSRFEPLINLRSSHRRCPRNCSFLSPSCPDFSPQLYAPQLGLHYPSQLVSPRLNLALLHPLTPKKPLNLSQRVIQLSSPPPKTSLKSNAALTTVLPMTSSLRPGLSRLRCERRGGWMIMLRLLGFSRGLGKRWRIRSSIKLIWRS